MVIIGKKIILIALTTLIILMLGGIVIRGIVIKKQTEKRAASLNIYQPLSKTEKKATGFKYNEKKLTYDLVWSDEFNYVGLPDPQKWQFETGGGGWGNNELQFYTVGDNAYVDGEKLIITARRENAGRREVTSSRIRTARRGDWLYGKIEVRAKVPKGLGTWPAIWMLPTDSNYGGWPLSGEIDIMEHVGFDLDVLVTSVHTEAYNHTKQTHKSKSVKRAGMTDDFNIYSIEWLPDKIKFFFNDELHFTYNPRTLLNSPTYKEWPFDKRFHLLINLAYGGDWGGAQGVDYNILPVTFEIDYVRVYQSPQINALIKP
jgi:beta-glucanase (GH16 family)